MNHFSYDVMRKEKVRSLQDEGLRSQAYYRSGSSRHGLLRGLPKLIAAILGMLGILGLLLR
jgi:hypothetical protein